MALNIPASVSKRIPLGIALVLTVLFVVLLMGNIRLNEDRNLLTNLDLLFRDFKYRVRGEKVLSDDVIVVGIDDKTLKALGSARSLSRKTFARLVDRIHEGQPKVIGFDIFFPEKERPAGCDSDRVEECELSEGDRLFAEAIQRAGNVVLAVALDSPKEDSGSDSGVLTKEKQEANKRATKEVEGFIEMFRDNPPFPHEYHTAERRIASRISSDGLTRNIDELSRASAGFGFVNLIPDASGRMRYQPQFIDYGGVFFPSLDIQLVRMYLDEKTPEINLTQSTRSEERFDWVRIGKREIPLDEFGRLQVNYDGGSFLHSASAVSMIDVLEGNKGVLDRLRGKIVLIGALSLALGDVVATPFDTKLPGVYLHANQIGNMLAQVYLTRSALAQIFDVILVLVFGIVLGLFLPAFNALRSFIYTTLLFAAHAAVNVLAFLVLQVELSFVYPGLALISVGASLIAYKYLTEERERQRTKTTFQYYLDPNVIERVMDQPDLLKLGGTKKEMSVLFSDIRGFTSFSEKMAPDEVVHFLNQYFDHMTGLIMKKEGCLDKLIGDAVMCFWGAPLELKDHAVRATICALEMLHKIEELRPILTLPGGARFDIGIGVNTGPMVVGNMGSQSRFAYTVMGDNVNLGSRLEALNKYYGTKILISDATFNECREHVYCRELDTIQVKGKSQAVTIYEPLGVRKTHEERRLLPDRRGAMTASKQAIRAMVFARGGDRRKADRRMVSTDIFLTPAQEEFALAYENALAYYRRGNFDVALKAFDRVLQLKPGDGPSILMKGRIAKFRAEHLASETFDPVYKFDEK